MKKKTGLRHPRKNAKSIFKIWFKEEFEDTKLVIRIRKSKKDTQHNGQKKKKYRRTNTIVSETNKCTIYHNKWQLIYDFKNV